MGVSGFLPRSISLRAVPQVESETAAQTAFSSDNCAVSFGEMGESPTLFHMNFAQSLLSESPCRAVSHQALL